jgi:hypothetical protein
VVTYHNVFDHGDHDTHGFDSSDNPEYKNAYETAQRATQEYLSGLMSAGGALQKCCGRGPKR